jgi:hypothetical protein
LFGICSIDEKDYFPTGGIRYAKQTTTIYASRKKKEKQKTRRCCEEKSK